MNIWLFFPYRETAGFVERERKTERGRRRERGGEREEQYLLPGKLLTAVSLGNPRADVMQILDTEANYQTLH